MKLTCKRFAVAPLAIALALSCIPTAAARNGVYEAYCAAHAHQSLASHEGWPPIECLKMDKGPAGISHLLQGLPNVHNRLLGGYGNDTIYAGDSGDVIWGDYHPSGQSESEQDRLHGGAGQDWIYSSHGYNTIWTGAGNDHVALIYGHGTVYCDGTGRKTLVMRYLPENRHWNLVGCAHKVIDRYRA